MQSPEREISPRERARLTARKALAARLADEGSNDLYNMLADCGLDLALSCTNCGYRKIVQTSCDRRWCPVCAWRIASARCDKYRTAASHFAWPLFVTLTVSNTIDVDGLKILKDHWTRFRRRKLIREKVRSGIVGFEVTNIGQGWHPHIHALLDCRWLSLRTPEPRRNDAPEEKTRKLKAAADELQRLWSDVISQDSSSVKIRRADAMALMEVLKYSVKGTTLLECKERITELIRLMDTMRLMTTFGAIRKEMPDETEEEEKIPVLCPQCGEHHQMITDKEISYEKRK